MVDEGLWVFVVVAGITLLGMFVLVWWAGWELIKWFTAPQIVCPRCRMLVRMPGKRRHCPRCGAGPL